MKDLYNIIESILDDEDEILDKSDKLATLAASIAWLQDHNVPVSNAIISNLDRYVDYFKNQDPKCGIWYLESSVLNITKKDKSIPDFIKIDHIRGLVIQDYLGETLPDLGLSSCDYMTIMNCPNLKSLRGCPIKLDRFSVSGCPKIVSLDGAPKEAKELFKVIGCGKKFTPNDIKRACRVDKNNMIY